MKRAIFILLLSLGGCSPYTINADYDLKADFSTYRTWSWFSGPRPSGPSLDGLTEGRIRDAIEHELPLRGLKKVEDGKADLLAAFHLSIVQRLEVTPTTVHYGYGWGHGYVGATYGNEVRSYDEGTLIIVLIDLKSGNLVWRGIARGTVYRSSGPEEREARIQAAVGGILDQYPPVR